MRTKYRRLFIVLLVVVIWGLVAGLSCLIGASKARSGKNDIEAAKAHADAAGLRDGTVEKQLNKAGNDMKAAHGWLANPLVQPWRVVPILGRQISSAIALTDSGHKISYIAGNGLNDANKLTDEAKTNRQATLARLAGIASTANSQLDALDVGPSKGLISPLADARRELITDVIGVQQGLQRAAAGANGAASLFNTNGNYLIFAANNGEMRSGSGMLLSAGLLSTGNGRVTVGDMKDVGNYNIANTAVTWPDELDKNWGWLQQRGKFQDLMLSPRFDVSAPIAEQIWKTSTGQDVDGVMVVDPEMLQAVLEATGPVDVNGRQFTADNVQHFLLYEQYQNVTDLSTNLARQDVLSDVAAAAFSALDKGNWDPVVLAKSLAEAANGRHLLLHANDPKIQQDWLTAGVAGTLDQNSMLQSIVNLGGNKLDQFLKVDSTVKQDVVATGYDYTVTTTITNSAPTTGAAYVIGPFPNSNLKAGEYAGLLNFNLPQDATGIIFDGQQNEFLSDADGPTQAIAVQTDLQAGQSATYVLHFYRAKTAQFTRVVPSARVPATTWHYGNQTWTDQSSHFIIP